MKYFKNLGFIAFCSIYLGYAIPVDYMILYKWKFLDFNMSCSMRNRLTKTGGYDPKNCTIGGVEVMGDDMYIALPRYLPGVPATLAIAKYDLYAEEPVKGFLLQPFPNWRMQEISVCEAFQSVISLEIDQFGRLWVLDQGVVNALSLWFDATCPPKLVIMDLKKKSIIRTYVFPSNVVSYTESELDRFVVACINKTHCNAYITDEAEDRIVAYDFNRNVSWAVFHSSMIADPKSTKFKILNKTYTIESGLDGIAISPKSKKFDRIYYSPLSGVNLYSVSTKTIIDAGLAGRVNLTDKEVTNHGKSKSQCDGFKIDSGGNMYYGRLTENTLITYNVSSQLSSQTETTLAHSDDDFQWIDSVTFDNHGNLIFISNKYHIFNYGGGYNLSIYNLRILIIPAVGNHKSYMYSD